MKNLILLTVFFVLFSTATAPAQEPTSTEVMEEWVRVNTPGEAHKRLEPFAGSWKTTTWTWMDGPDSEPAESFGESEAKWILDGRFLREEASSEFTMPGPERKPMTVPYGGMGLLGHDNVRNQYVTIWVDTMSTNVTKATGSFDKSGKVLTMYATLDEPALGVYGRWIRLVFTLESQDKHRFEMFDLHAGEDYKVMEMVYERKK